MDFCWMQLEHKLKLSSRASPIARYTITTTSDPFTDFLSVLFVTLIDSVLPEAIFSKYYKIGFYPTALGT